MNINNFKILKYGIKNINRNKIQHLLNKIKTHFKFDIVFEIIVDNDPNINGTQDISLYILEKNLTKKQIKQLNKVTVILRLSSIFVMIDENNMFDTTYNYPHYYYRYKYKDRIFKLAKQFGKEIKYVEF